jgi:hypothetical protein
MPPKKKAAAPKAKKAAPPKKTIAKKAPKKAGECGAGYVTRVTPNVRSQQS